MLLRAAGFAGVTLPSHLCAKCRALSWRRMQVHGGGEQWAVLKRNLVFSPSSSDGRWCISRPWRRRHLGGPKDRSTDAESFAQRWSQAGSHWPTHPQTARRSAVLCWTRRRSPPCQRLTGEQFRWKREVQPVRSFSLFFFLVNFFFPWRTSFPSGP